MSEKVSIIIPNFKTPELTRICLRLIRRYTPEGLARVIVIDNDSADESLEYIRQVEWIRLIERKVAPGEASYEMHAKALDQAFAEVDTPFVLVMHTDTLVHSPQWLDFLLSRFDSDEKLAGSGSWKLEKVSIMKHLGQRIEEFIRRLSGRKDKKREEEYLRSHCAIYRTDAIRQYTNGFYDGKTAGLSLHRKLVAAGFRMEFLESAELGRYISHLNHASAILNPKPTDRKTGKPAARRKLNNKIMRSEYQDVLDHPELDRL